MMRSLLASAALCVAATLAYAQADTSSPAAPPVATAPAATADAAPTAAIRAEPTAGNDASVPNAEAPATASWPSNTWPFDGAKTLRENVEDWAQHAGWRVLWLATDPYEIDGKNEPLIGEFPAVLTPVASGTGLQICAQRRIRRVVVSDSTFICKDSQ